MKHLIIFKQGETLQSKHLRDCQALAKAIRLNNHESDISLTNEYYNLEGYNYIWHSFDDITPTAETNTKIIKYDPRKLYYYKFAYSKPIKHVSKESRYQLLYTGSGEPGRLLELVDCSKYQSASYGVGDDTRGLHGHACFRKTSVDQIELAINMAHAILVLDGGISHCLCEALAHEKPVLIDRKADLNKTLGFDDWNYVATCEEIQYRLKNIPIDQMVKQNQVKEQIWRKLYDTRLKIADYLNQ